MNERTQDRLFAACGIASAVLVHVGLFVGLASGQAFVNLASSPAKVAHELAKPAGTGVWVGAYLGLLGFCVFLAFAVIFVTLVLQGLTLPPLIRLLRITSEKGDREEALARLKEHSVLLSTTVWPAKLRAVTHLDVTDEDIDAAIEAMPRALGALARA